MEVKMLQLAPSARARFYSHVVRLVRYDRLGGFASHRTYPKPPFRSLTKFVRVRILKTQQKIVNRHLNSVLLPWGLSDPRGTFSAKDTLESLGPQAIFKKLYKYFLQSYMSAQVPLASLKV